jgi:hypothetical protein
LILDKLWVNVVELGNTDGSRLSHVRIVVLQSCTERVAQVLRDSVDTDTACTRVSVRIRVCVRMYAYVYVCACMRVCMCMCMCMRLRVCACACVCMCVCRVKHLRGGQDSFKFRRNRELLNGHQSVRVASGIHP